MKVSLIELLPVPLILKANFEVPNIFMLALNDNASFRLIDRDKKTKKKCSFYAELNDKNASCFYKLNLCVSKIQKDPIFDEINWLVKVNNFGRSKMEKEEKENEEKLEKFVSDVDSNIDLAEINLEQEKNNKAKKLLSSLEFGFSVILGNCVLNGQEFLSLKPGSVLKFRQFSKDFPLMLAGETVAFGEIIKDESGLIFKVKECGV